MKQIFYEDLHFPYIIPIKRTFYNDTTCIILQCYTINALFFLIELEMLQ